MELKKGKFYNLRDGRKAECISDHIGHKHDKRCLLQMPSTANKEYNDYMPYTLDGKRCQRSMPENSSYDVISESLDADASQKKEDCKECIFRSEMTVELFYRMQDQIKRLQDVTGCHC